jgi:hypothetical protein
MKSIQLTENQILAVVNYLLETELSVSAALQACYIEAEEPGYFANELDSVSRLYLEERIFQCAVCNLWTKMFEQAHATMRNAMTLACEICLMSAEDIFDSDSHFLCSCGIRAEVLTVTENPPRCPDIAGALRPRCRLIVTDADLDFLSACGIRVRMSPADTARRKRLKDEKGNSLKQS